MELHKQKLHIFQVSVGSCWSNPSWLQTSTIQLFPFSAKNDQIAKLILTPLNEDAMQIKINKIKRLLNATKKGRKEGHIQYLDVTNYSKNTNEKIST